MSGDVVVIAIGNSYRRDDGVGPAVAAAYAQHDRDRARAIVAAAEAYATDEVEG